MKPTTFVTLRNTFFLVSMVLATGLVAWNNKQNPGYIHQAINDTVPQKDVQRDKKIRNLDDVLNNLDEADNKLDEEKIKKEIAEAIKNIDADKIKMQIEKAMKEVDMAKIQAEVNAAIARVDFEKIKKEINNTLKEVDMTKIQEEIKASLAKIDWDNMKSELEKVRDIDTNELHENLKKVKEELKNLEPELKENLQKAKKEIEKSKAEMKAYKTFTDGLDKDGLINKHDVYKIKYKDGVLEINDKKAGKDVYKKYKEFLKNHTSFLIQKDNDNFNINTD